MAWLSQAHKGFKVFRVLLRLKWSKDMTNFINNWHIFVTFLTGKVKLCENLKETTGQILGGEYLPLLIIWIRIRKWVFAGVLFLYSAAGTVV